MQVGQDLLDTLLSSECFIEQLQHATDGFGAAKSGGSPSAAHNNLSMARAVQAAAQLSGDDVPMLEDLLPLSDLHDPFLPLSHDLQYLSQQQAGHAPQQPHNQQQAPCGPLPGRGQPTMEDQTGFWYAEPNSPAAALLNNSAAAQVELACLPSVGSASLPAALVAAVQLQQQHQQQQGAGYAFAASAAAFGAAQQQFNQQQQHAASPVDAGGLPPAIAAAQRKALQLQQLQAAAVADKASSGGGGVTSHMSNGSDSVANTAQRPPSVGAAAGTTVTHACTSGGLPVSEDSSGEQPPTARGQRRSFDEYVTSGLPCLAAAPDGMATTTVTGATTLLDTAPCSPSAPGQSVFSTGAGTAAPARRGGRPREKKSYDALIDPSLPQEEIRRLRRMLSNRESARRSRRRRQSQLSTLEVELEQLKTDNERLESELTQASSFMQQLAADKQALLMEVERLRCQLTQVLPGGAVQPSPALPAMSMSVPTPQMPCIPIPMPSAMAAPAAVPSTMPPAAAGLCHLAPLAEEPSPAPLSGRLPPFIEEAQRLAHKLTQKRPKDEPHA